MARGRGRKKDRDFKHGTDADKDSDLTAWRRVAEALEQIRQKGKDRGKDDEAAGSSEGRNNRASGEDSLRDS